jgi:hypothetical protein
VKASETLVALTAIGCGTGVACMLIEKLFPARRPGAEAEVERLREQSGRQAERIGQLEHQNDQLQRQLEWHARLLDAQELVEGRQPASLPG